MCLYILTVHILLNVAAFRVSMLRLWKFELITLLFEEDLSLLWRSVQACGGPGHCGETCSALQSSSFPGLRLSVHPRHFIKSILELRKAECSSCGRLSYPSQCK